MQTLLAEEVSILNKRILEGSSGDFSFITDQFNDFKLDSGTRHRSLEVECLACIYPALTMSTGQV